MLRTILPALGCAVLLTACTGTTTPATESAGTTVPPASAAVSSPAATSIQAGWWQWAATEPEQTSPVADTTGAQCALHQPADVWFLAGTFGGAAKRACAVPAGVRIVAPALNLVGDDTIDCAGFLDGSTATIQLDGKAVPLRRIDRETITFTAGPGNALTGSSGRTRAEACGLWAEIPAPSAGKHTVHIQGKSGTFALDVEYTLTVA